MGGWLKLHKGVDLQIAGTDKILTVKRVCLNDRYILEMETLTPANGGQGGGLEFEEKPLQDVYNPGDEDYFGG